MEVQKKESKLGGLIGLLFSRLLLFAFFQLLISLVLQSWSASEKYWMLTATLTNLVSIGLLIVMFRREGLQYITLLRVKKLTERTDIILLIGFVLFSMPLVVFPSLCISNMIWGNTTYYHQVLFQPLPVWLISMLLVAFPGTIALAELATYFGYIMPRLEKRIPSKWVAVLLPVFFLSIQHSTLPLVVDPSFIFFRAIMYLPFALLIGIILYKRPILLPYLAMVHFVLDAAPVIMLLTQTLKTGG